MERTSPRPHHAFATVTAAEQEGRPKQRAFCIAALQDGDDLSELRELLRTAGVAVVGQAVQHRDKPHPNTYLGPGKVEEVKAAAKAADANVVAVRRRALAASGAQPRGASSGIPVIDRTAIILDIFADHAQQRRGQAPGRARAAQYNLARMRGLWTHLERLGARPRRRRHRHPGPGRVPDRDRPPPGARPHLRAASASCAEVKASRAVMRAERERAHLPQVALAGYTNAGKSTLLNALTGATVGVARPPLPHARPEHARRAARRPALPADRHRRLHPQAAPPARRRVRRDAGGDAPRRPHPARRRRLGRRGRDGRDDCAPSTTSSRRSAPASGRACSCSTRPTRSTTSAARSCASATPTGSSSRR